MTTWRIFCAATNARAITTRFGSTFCDWRGGTRKAETKDAAERKPCPRCGGHVTAFPTGR